VRSDRLRSGASTSPATNKQDNFNFQKVGDILPRDEDYISVNFRALSKRIVEGHWIDWSKDDVLKNSAPRSSRGDRLSESRFHRHQQLARVREQRRVGRRRCPVRGRPGINAEYKIDALMNPRIARGLLMQPPAIHSTSMTVLFKFEFSHPDIATESRWRFLRAARRRGGRRDRSVHRDGDPRVLGSFARIPGSGPAREAI
jgi:hypothetical protein